jgi:hypothetical protein
MKLLLGYQLLGTGRLNEAAWHLENAGLNSNTNQAAALLIDVLEKIREGRDSKTNPIHQQPENPATPTESKDKTAVKTIRQDIDLPALATAADKWLGEQ